MRFFRKSPGPGPAPRRVHHPWNPPEAEFPGIVAMETLHFDRSEQAAVAIIGVAAYARGFEFVLARRVRPGTPGLDKTLRRRCAGAGTGSRRSSCGSGLFPTGSMKAVAWSKF